jgi:maltose-binding protein MalE
MIEIGGGLWWDIDTDVRTLYYRRDMLQDAGIDPAELDAENGPITVARITEIAASLRRGLHLFASWSSCQPVSFLVLLLAD